MKGLVDMDKKLLKILSKYSITDKKKITKDLTLIGDLGLDSMDFVDLIADLEKEFDIKVNDKEVLEIKTVGDIEEYVSKCLSVKGK